MAEFFTQLAAGVYAVSGIDTDAGKTIVTGWLERQLLAAHRSVATLKLVQTGSVAGSPDIAMHRRISGRTLPEDASGITAPQVFAHPASPHLAAALEHRTVDLAAIEAAVAHLRARYDIVLVECAGGLMVPLTPDLLTIDYVASQGWPMIFVTSAKLGALNHTLLSWEALQSRSMAQTAVVWNTWFDATDAMIASDSRAWLKRKLALDWHSTAWLECPVLDVR